ncbi:MAG: AraC family transcriptional regulator [Candidatus Cryptobacteroides sp.]|nr:AraC family transcriptional regulator [Candidatus Cryptobacteroides sp.]
MDMTSVITEITPLSDRDCFYIVERHKTEFVFPLHRHREYELNFIEHGKGVRRVVGDSVEEIGEYELTLIAGGDLEHAWEQGNCTSEDVREITIQFDPEIFSSGLMMRNQFSSIQHMFEQARSGLTFSLAAIMKVYSLLDALPSEIDKFDQFQHFMRLLYDLSLAGDSRILASTSFAHNDADKESRRVQKIKQYVGDHFAENITLEELAEMVGMSPSAFSRFFKSRTGKTVIDYIIDIRLGNAARLLVDTTQNISEICYSCGFNNLSNFNRLFKSKRGYTPREFRTLFKKNKVFV